MGLQSQLIDISSNSLPFLLLAVVANCIASLRSFILSLLSSSRSPAAVQIFSVDDDGNFPFGSRRVTVLAEQKKVNRISSYSYRRSGAGEDLGCVVCMCGLRDGNRVRRLDCRHVFHKKCFDGWLDHMNFNCPLCRSPVVTDERVERTCRRVDGGVTLGRLSSSWWY